MKQIIFSFQTCFAVVGCIREILYSDYVRFLRASHLPNAQPRAATTPLSVDAQQVLAPSHPGDCTPPAASLFVICLHHNSIRHRRSIRTTMTRPRGSSAGSEESAATPREQVRGQTAHES